MKTFNASVQHGDLSGVIKTDDAYNNIYNYLNNSSKLNQGEVPFGILANLSESDIRTGLVSVTFIVADIGNSTDIPSYLEANKGNLTLKEICVEMGVTELLSHFKQISFTLSPVTEMNGIQYTPIQL